MFSQKFIANSQTLELVRGNIRSLHKNKATLSDSSYRVDTTLSKITEILCSDTFKAKHANITHEDIRSVLHERLIYDYNVHFLSIPVKSLKDVDIYTALKNQDSLQILLDNPYIEKQGVVIEQIKGQYVIHLLFTEKYIDSIETKGEISDLYGGGVEHNIKITGKSRLKDLYFTYKGLKDKNKVETDSAGNFQINIKMHEFLAPPFEFFDINGKELFKF
jgi:hypothetical protein